MSDTDYAAEMEPGTMVGGGRYSLLKIVGKGGMGVVWLAEDSRLQEQVALKFLPREISHDPTALDDMRRETLKSHRLSHPNIIRIHDLVETEGEPPFISMEYVDGPSLSALKVEQPERLFPWEYLEPLVQQLCQALSYAHGEGVVHRDLKPANIILDARGRLKLADFGIAATVSESVSRVSLQNLTSGTVAYMSPQQMNGEIPKVSDDIYAFGATVYELLTSKPPFFSGDFMHQVRKVVPQTPMERLAALELANEIPADVSAMLMACLSKDPAQRPPSAEAVAAWLGLEATSPNASEFISEGEIDMGETVVSARSSSGIFSLVWVVPLLLVCLGTGFGIWKYFEKNTGTPRGGGGVGQKASAPNPKSPMPEMTSSTEKSLDYGTTKDWLPTGFYMVEGGYYEIKATGRWKGSDGKVYGPTGQAMQPPQLLVAPLNPATERESYLGTHPRFALLGTTGERKTSFFVGENCRIRCPSSGELMLRMNEDPATWTDRPERLHVEVRHLETSPFQQKDGELRITARIDSSDDLHITSEGLHWQHIGGGDRVGRIGVNQYPTMVNDVQWWPKFQSRGRTEPLAAPGLLPSTFKSVQLLEKLGRGKVTVKSATTKKVVLTFNDGGRGSSTLYVRCKIE